MNNPKCFLKLEVIWKDDHMFELKVIVSNGFYSGTTEVYDTSESLSGFAKTLYRFPKDEKSIIFYEAGEKDSHAYFSMKFYCLDAAGHIAVQVTLEKNVATIYRPEKKDKLTLEILVDPNAIDEFQKQLLRQASTQEGEAILIGYSG